MIAGQTFADVYPHIIRQVLRSPETGPRGLKTKDAGHLSFQILDGADRGLYTNPIRSTNLRYYAAETLWYLSADPKIQFIAQHAKLWSRIANPDGTANSNYGHRIFGDNASEWRWALDSIIKDPDTRQAVIPIHSPKDHYPTNKDVPCTMAIGFRSRDSVMHTTRVLDMHVTMRSNDAYFGLPYDVPFFLFLQRLMCVHLKQEGIDHYPGNYKHTAWSMHAYDKDWDTLKRMAQQPFQPLTDVPSLNPTPPINVYGDILPHSPFYRFLQDLAGEHREQ